MKPSFQLIIKEEAQAEILETYGYYEEQQIGLGDYFLSALKQRFDSLCMHPQASPIVYAAYRQAVVFKFPFVIVYEVEKDQVVVYSVFHTSRHPDGKIK